MWKLHKNGADTIYKRERRPDQVIVGDYLSTDVLELSQSPKFEIIITPTGEKIKMKHIMIRNIRIITMRETATNSMLEKIIYCVQEYLLRICRAGW